MPNPGVIAAVREAGYDGSKQGIKPCDVRCSLWCALNTLRCTQ